MLSYVTQALVLLHFLFLVSFSFRILIRDDLTSAARLAWGFFLMFVPYAGIVVYLLFGEINLGRTLHQRHDDVFEALRSRVPHWMGTASWLDERIPAVYQAAFHAAAVDEFRATVGNDAELMPDGETARRKMVQDIDQATRSVCVLYYIWLDDQTGSEIAAALVRASERGVRCWAMADGLGSRKFLRTPWWKKMQQAGVRTSVAMPIRGALRTFLFSRLDLRNHRKITVIDGHTTWCGSQNCADEAFLVKPKFGPWVDIMLRFRGPVARQMQLLFASDWLLNNPGITVGELLEHFQAGAIDHPSGNVEEDVPREIASHQRDNSGVIAQVFADGPTDRRGVTPQFFSTLLASVQREVVISTPYFVPDSTLLDALCGAGYRGVQVTMIFPQRNDSWIVAAASHSHYRRLLASGIRIFEYRGGLLHAKTVVVDQCLTLVGSTNLDLRSFDLNYENNILFYDASLSGDVFKRQQDYLEQSDEVTLQAVTAWPIYRRIWNNVIATAGPIL